MKSIFAFGFNGGSGVELCRYAKNIGPTIHYRYSKTFLCHKLTFGRFVLAWRFGAPKEQNA